MKKLYSSKTHLKMLVVGYFHILVLYFLTASEIGLMDHDVSK